MFVENDEATENGISPESPATQEADKYSSGMKKKTHTPLKNDTSRSLADFLERAFFVTYSKRATYGNFGNNDLKRITNDI